jgi:superoxide dismutase, Cu-Zn family
VPHTEHAGDLTNLYVTADGGGALTVLTDRITVDDLVAGDGVSVIVHTPPDNYANIPTRSAPMPDMPTLGIGDSVPRIDRGVVRRG